MTSFKTAQAKDTIAALTSRENNYEEKFCRPRPVQAERSSKGFRGSPVSIMKESLPHLSLAEESRGLICDWMYKVVDRYNIEREAISFGMSYFDRYVMKFPNECTTKEECQLIAVTSLYLAVKVHDMKRSGTIEFFSQLSRNRFSTKDIEAMEQKILVGLGWYMNPATPQSFVYHFVQLLATIVPESTQSSLSHIYEVANYIAEVSLLRSSISHKKASTLAFASFIIAIGEAKETVISQGHYDVVVSSIFSYNFSSSNDISLVTETIMDTLQSNEAHLNLQQLLEKLDPKSLTYKH